MSEQPDAAWWPLTLHTEYPNDVPRVKVQLSERRHRWVFDYGRGEFDPSSKFKARYCVSYAGPDSDLGTKDERWCDDLLEVRAALLLAAAKPYRKGRP